MTYGDIARLNLGDYIVVPLTNGTKVRFDVVHVTREAVYFLSRCAIVEKSRRGAGSACSRIANLIPRELLDSMRTVDHLGYGQSKIILPSLYNFTNGGASVFQSDYVDLQMFDLFKPQHINLANKSQEWSWTDTDAFRAPLKIAYRITERGLEIRRFHGSHKLGVRVCFAIERK